MRYALAWGWVLALGCGASDGVGLGDDDDDDTPTNEACDDGAPVDTYVAGIAEPGAAGQVTVSITSAVPAPPDRGLNSWVFEVVDAGGAPLTSATVTVSPFMPLHGHGTTPLTFTTTGGGDGTFSVGDVNLHMPGLWELTVDVVDGGAGIEDAAVFRFCVEG